MINKARSIERGVCDTNIVVDSYHEQLKLCGDKQIKSRQEYMSVDGRMTD